jgi:hypothetical protein
VKYIVEYQDFQGKWKLRGEYPTYKAALARWQRHYQHCPYLLCRIRKTKTRGVVMDLLLIVAGGIGFFFLLCFLFD